MFKHLWSSLICLVTEAVINFYFCERELIIRGLIIYSSWTVWRVWGGGDQRSICGVHAICFWFLPEPIGLTVSNLAFSILWEMIPFQFLSGCAGLCLLVSWEYGQASFPWFLAANTLNLYLSVERAIKLVREEMSISTWACSEVLGFCTYLCPWSTGIIDVLGTTNQNPLPVHLSAFASFDHSFLSPPVSSTHTFPVSFVSLCRNGSVLQCSDFFLHLSFA